MAKWDISNIDENFEAHKATITVIGVGGGGCNTISTIAEMGIKGASTAAVNTDARHLVSIKADKKVLIGKNLTRGLGAGGYPDTGKNAALESREELRNLVAGCDLVFLTCGLGGGTGTGALPVLAGLAKQQGAITIAVVTLPFRLEGTRVGKAEEGLVALRQNCDTVIAIENERLLKVGGNLPVKKSFDLANNLIAMMIKGITETISEPSLVNLDYADVKAVMRAGGVASIGVGSSDSERRAEDAVKIALNHPLLDVEYAGAKGALIQVIGGEDMKLDEIDLIGSRIQAVLDPDAQVVWGARISPDFSGKIQVITIITGVQSPYILGMASKEELGKVKTRESKELGIKVIR
jgi:cell division protein FtsZ